MVSVKSANSTNAFPIQYMRNRKTDVNDVVLLYGYLREFSLLDLIQFFSIMKKTGELRIVQKDNHMKAVMHFEKGVLVNITCGEKAGEEALMCVICMTDGVFSFRNGSEGCEKNLNLTTQSILMCIVQFLDNQRLSV